MNLAAPIVLSAIDLGVVLIVFAMLVWAAVQDGRTQGYTNSTRCS
jgi:hypothetical protein